MVFLCQPLLLVRPWRSPRQWVSRKNSPILPRSPGPAHPDCKWRFLRKPGETAWPASSQRAFAPIFCDVLQRLPTTPARLQPCQVGPLLRCRLRGSRIGDRAGVRAWLFRSARERTLPLQMAAGLRVAASWPGIRPALPSWATSQPPAGQGVARPCCLAALAVEQGKCSLPVIGKGFASHCGPPQS